MNQSAAFIGPAGWQYPDWAGVVYPSPKPRGLDALSYLSSYFNLIEINSTFYRIPARDVCRSWTERTPDPFAFTLKAHQSITHEGEPDGDTVAAFRRAIEPLHAAGKLRGVLLQYPWSFRCDDSSLDRVRRSIEGLSPYPVAVEVRHGSWDDDDCIARVAECGAAVCAIDQPIIGDSLRPHRFAPSAGRAYFRFHGRNYGEWFRNGATRDSRYDYLYTEDELKPWVETIRRTREGGNTVSIVMNNHFRGQAPANAFVLMSMLSGNKVPAPAPLRRAFPMVRAFTKEAGDDERTLFDGLESP